MGVVKHYIVVEPVIGPKRVNQYLNTAPARKSVP